MKTTETKTYHFEIEIEGYMFKFSQTAETMDEARLTLVGKMEKALEAFKKPIAPEDQDK